MNASISDERLFRQYERTLDAFHQTLPIWKRPRPEALLGTLMAFDLYSLPIALGVGFSAEDPGAAQRIKSIYDSLIYALRFLWHSSTDLTVWSIVDESLIEEGAQFLQFCSDYGVLTDFHIGFGHGYYSLEIDEPTKTVRFALSPKHGATPLAVGILEDTSREWHHSQDASQAAKGRVIELLKSVPYHIESGRIVFSDFRPLLDPVIKQALTQLLPSSEWSLNDSNDLGGVKVSEYRAFWHALYSWSMAAMAIYISATLRGCPQHEYVPTQCVERSHFIQVIRQLSGLPEAAVRLCLDRLSFGQDSPKNPDPYLQPLLSQGSKVAWSPHLIQLCKFERNALKTMARTATLKPLADNLIGGRESVLTRKLGRLLGEHGYQYKFGIQLPGGIGEIDLLAFKPRHKAELLVVELKGVLEVDEINEVEHVTRETIKGQKQLRKVVEYLKNADPSVKRSLWRGVTWETVSSYFGVVITPEAQPSTNYDHSEFPAITLETAARYLTKSNLRSPRKFWQACVSKPWLASYRGYTLSYQQIRVGELCYEVPLQSEGDSRLEFDQSH